MRSAILPVQPVLRDFIRNLWVLRFFLLLLASLWVISSAVTTWMESPPPAMPMTLVTAFGRAAGALNSLINKLLLGILLWVVQQSLRGHALKRSRYLLFPTGEDL